MLQRPSLATLLLLITLGPMASAQSPVTFTGRVVGVLDGDSLLVLDGQRQVELRLHGVDAPEGGQAYGGVCKRTLSTLVSGKTVAVRIIDIDRYKRSVSRVTVDGRDAGLEMIHAGCAWHYRQYSDDAGYAAAEQDARRARRGLWQDARPVAPWDYRRPRSSRDSPPAGRGLLAAPTVSTSGPFHGNLKSLIFHAPGCASFDCKNCVAVFANREAAVAAGYRPPMECAGR